MEVKYASTACSLSSGAVGVFALRCRALSHLTSSTAEASVIYKSSVNSQRGQWAKAAAVSGVSQNHDRLRDPAFSAGAALILKHRFHCSSVLLLLDDAVLFCCWPS